MITKKILKHIFTLKSSKGKQIILQCPYTLERVELVNNRNINLKKKEFLLYDGEIMTKPQENNFNKAFKVERFYLKELGEEDYETLHNHLDLLLTNYNSIDDYLFYAEKKIPESVINKFLAAQAKYKELKSREYKRTHYAFKFYSKEEKAIEVLNNLCSTHDLLIKPVRNFYVIKSEDANKQILPILGSYFESLPKGNWSYIIINK